MEIALLHGYLVNAYNLTGNYSLAEHHRPRAIDSCTCLENRRGLVNNLVGMAITRRYTGILDEADEIGNVTRLFEEQRNHEQADRCFHVPALSCWDHWHLLEDETIAL